MKEKIVKQCFFNIFHTFISKKLKIILRLGRDFAYSNHLLQIEFDFFRNYFLKFVKNKNLNAFFFFFCYIATHRSYNLTKN